MRSLRGSFALLLVAAVAVAPTLLDGCTEACEAAHAAAAGPADPICHRATAADRYLSTQLPAPCTHDHSGSITSTSPGADIPRVSGAVVAVPAAPTASVPAALNSSVTPPNLQGSPPGARIRLAPVPLRV